MSRVRRLAQLWNWLPAFRVVAETRHLPTASEALGITAPALSRTIKQLEEAIGQPLFSRTGRRLALNDAGEAFLVAVRHAMRGLDETLENIEERALVGPVRLSARSHHGWIFVRPALRRLRAACPELVPHVYTMASTEALDRLREGSIDVVITERAESASDLAVERLADITYGVYCGPGHPLDRADPVSDAELLEHEFIAPVAGVDDHWPLDLERRVGICVSAFHDAVHLCVEGNYLAMLPDATALEYLGPERLRRVSTELAPRTPVFAVSRCPVSSHPRTDAVLQALREHVAAVAHTGMGILPAPTRP